MGLHDCPPSDQLERLLLGRLPEKEATILEEHLLHCPHCGETLGVLPATDALVRAMSAAVDADVAEVQRRAQAYAPWFKRLAHSADSTAPPTVGVETLPPTGTYLPRFDFLASPLGADELGRLGPYVVRETLGAGGMGMVFLGEDPRLARAVALKVIRPEMVGSADARRRFLDEARAIAAVEHDHIIAVYEVNEENGIPYLVMPLLRGQSLEDRLRRIGGPMPIDEVLRIGREMASGLSAAHERGLIHRDIKPANVFLVQDENDRVKILDFGLAQSLSAPGDELSENRVVGTPAYMAPEQAQCLPVDARADLFSLGCVLYRLATGREPFRAGDIMSLLMQVVMDEPAPVREVNPKVPIEVERLISSLMRKKPEDRPASAQAVVEAIRAIERRRAAPRRWLWAGLAATVLVFAVTLTAWLTRPAPVKPAEPVEVAFLLDEPGFPQLIVAGGEKEETLDLKQKTHKLLPGRYTLRLAKATGRTLLPAEITLEEGQDRRFELCLVGEVRRDDNHGSAIWDVACGGKGDALVVLSADNDHTVGVWKANTDERSDFFPKKEHKRPVRAVALTPDGKVGASAGGGKGKPDDHVIRLWDVAKREVKSRLVGHGDTVTALALTADGKRLLSGDAEGAILLWNVAKAKSTPFELGHNALGVNAVALSADGKWAVSGGGDKQVILWDAVAAKVLKRHRTHEGEVQTVAMSPDGSLVASAGQDGRIVLWDAKAEKTWKLGEHKDGVYRVAFSPDGKRLLSGGADGMVRLWDVASSKEILPALKGHQGAVYGVAFAEGGRRAVSGGKDQTLRLWELPR